MRFDGLSTDLRVPPEVKIPALSPKLRAIRTGHPSNSSFYFFGRDSGGTRPDRR
jgi:hypothetical protein